MEKSNYSYTDSGDSSPRSREIDCDNNSWDETQSSYKVKFMCSYGGKIQLRPHDNQLTYVGGETMILAVDRNTKFSGIVTKLSSICDSEVHLKYQLPGEDLDALVSVTNDEDLEHMMIEYDRLHRSSPKPARLRLFLFPVKTFSPLSYAGSDTTKNNQQWFAGVFNSAQSHIHSVEASSPSAFETPTKNPDFLFGLEKGSPPEKLLDPRPLEFQIRSDLGGGVEGEQVVCPIEIQRQIQEFQRMQISNQEQVMYQRKCEENLTRAYAPGDYYVQKVSENTVSLPGALPAQPPTVSVIPSNYWQDRHIQGSAVAGAGAEHSVYYIQTPTGYYQAAPPPAVHQQQVKSPGNYTMQRVPPGVCRESPVYSVAPPQAQPRMVTGNGDGVGMVRPQPTGGVGGVAVAEGGGGCYAQVAYDSAGRQVYYTAAPAGGVGVMTSSNYQTMTAAGAAVAGMDLRQQQQQQTGGGPLMVNHQEGNVPPKLLSDFNHF